MIRLSFKTLSFGLATLACLLSAPAGADQITYEMVTVGDPGNANDTGGSGIGAVAYTYQIGKYDVTIGQYAAFLNAVAATDTYSLYNSSMGSDGNIKGIHAWRCDERECRGRKPRCSVPSSDGERVVQGRLLLTELRWVGCGRLLCLRYAERHGPGQHHRKHRESGELVHRQRVFRHAVVKLLVKPKLPDRRWRVHE